MRLLKKKAIVTGANRSIGKAIAIAFAKEGADVVISYRSDEAGARQAVEEMQNMGRKAHALYADFSQLEDVERFFQQALAHLGSLDILVNNAATYFKGDFLKTQVADFEKILKINVTAPLYLSQLAAKAMIEKEEGGQIINISAITGERPYPARTGHATAKAALNMLTKSMALELAPFNIRVNAIAPGTVPYESDSPPADDIPLKRTGTPEDQAQAAVYLASKESSWMTGQILTIDGGQSLSF